jgi:hypothetical protein
MNSDHIGKYLGLPPMDEILDGEVIEQKKLTSDAKKLSDRLTQNLPKEPKVSTQEVDDDYEYARNNMYDAIGKGSQALEELSSVAQQSQHPQAYEVLAKTIKTLIDANKELVDLSKRKSEEKKLSNGPHGGSGGVTNNNLFVGTTHDLLKVLADMRKNGKSE